MRRFIDPLLEPWLCPGLLVVPVRSRSLPRVSDSVFLNPREKGEEKRRVTQTPFPPIFQNQTEEPPPTTAPAKEKASITIPAPPCPKCSNCSLANLSTPPTPDLRSSSVQLCPYTLAPQMQVQKESFEILRPMVKRECESFVVVWGRLGSLRGEERLDQPTLFWKSRVMVVQVCWWVKAEVKGGSGSAYFSFASSTSRKTCFLALSQTLPFLFLRAALPKWRMSTAKAFSPWMSFSVCGAVEVTSGEGFLGLT